MGTHLVRRGAGLLLLVVLTAVLSAPAALAESGQQSLTLATEAQEGEAPGLEPMPADATDNPAAPDDYEANFLWGAAVGLLALMLIGAAAIAALYYLMVVRPAHRQTAGR